MLHFIKQRIADMRAIRTLCLGAEREAHADGETEPGLEHFLLAALDLPDGTARRAFERVGVQPDKLRPAIAQQYVAALAGIGIVPGALAAAVPVPLGAAKGLYRSKAQVQDLMRALHEGARPGDALTGARVVSAIAAVPHGVAARALAALGIDPQALSGAADALTDGR